MARKFLVMFVACWCLLGIAVASAANIKDYPTVAVMNFGNKAVMAKGLRNTDLRDY